MLFVDNLPTKQERNKFVTNVPVNKEVTGH